MKGRSPSGGPQETPLPVAWLEWMVCRKMHWTYTQLEEQPAYRVEEALVFLALEGEALRPEEPVEPRQPRRTRR